jgi:hypothetical protein
VKLDVGAKPADQTVVAGLGGLELFDAERAVRLAEREDHQSCSQARDNHYHQLSRGSAEPLRWVAMDVGRPVRCQQTSLIDGWGHSCLADAVDATGAPLEIVVTAEDAEPADASCLAHHPDRSTLLGVQAARGMIDLSRAVIEDSTLAELRRCLQQIDARVAPTMSFRGASFYTGVLADIAFPSDVVFTEAAFHGRPEPRRRTRVGLGVAFRNCRFQGSVFFHGVEAEQLLMSACQVDGALQLKYGKFARLEVEDCTFGRVVWRGVTIGHELNVCTTTFAGDATFEEVKCDGRVDFKRTTFERDATFEEVKCKMVPSFEAVVFRGPVRFLDTSSASEEAWDVSKCQFGPSVDLPDAPVVLRAVSWLEPARITLGEGPLRLRGCVIDVPLSIAAPRVSARELQAHTPRQQRSRADLEEITDCTLLARVGIDVELFNPQLSLIGSSGLANLDLPPGNWRRERGRAVIADEETYLGSRPGAVEDVYRQLRAGLEAKKEAPAAADFYIGELNARQLNAGHHDSRNRLDHILLPVYWHVGGYGVRAVRPLAWLTAVLVATAVLLRLATAWFVRPADHVLDGYHLDRFWDALAFVMRNSISFLSAPASGLTAAGTFLFVFERYAAVALLALTVFAVRSRVQR